MYHRHGTPLPREGIYSTGSRVIYLIYTLLLGLQPCLVHFISEKYVFVSISLSNTGWSGMWVSAKVYGSVYFYWNPLSVGSSCILILLSIYSISLDSSEYKVVSTLLMFTNSFMWCIFALIQYFSTRNVTAITSEPFSWLEHGWRRSSGLLSPMIQDSIFPPVSHDLWSSFLPAWWLRVLRDS